MYLAKSCLDDADMAVANYRGVKGRVYDIMSPYDS